MKRSLVFVLCCFLMLTLAGCGSKISAADAFSRVGLTALKDGSLYEDSAKVARLTKAEKELAPDMPEYGATFRYIFDGEKERDIAVDEYIDYLTEKGWSEDGTDTYVSSDGKGMVTLDKVGPLKGDYEKKGMGGKMAIFATVRYNK